MRSFIQYHNCDKLGWVPLDTRPFLETELAIYTRRPGVTKAIGARVYLIASLGKPKRFYLWETFEITRVQKEDKDFAAVGNGWQLGPPVRLVGEEFEVFKKACANFIGFRCIDDLPFRQTLHDLAAQHRATGITPEMERFCTELTVWKPKSGDVWYARGVVRAHLGQRAGAVEDLRRAVGLETEFIAEAKQWLQRLQTGFTVEGSS